MATIKEIIRWVGDALATKDIGPAVTHYLIKDGMISATNGTLTASHPWPYDDEFLVSGLEFEKVLGRMEQDDPTIKRISSDKVVVRCGRFHGTIYTLSSTDWVYPGVENAKWLPLPETLTAVLKTLRAFISDNPSQQWAGCVALEHGNAYSTNNIALAGIACPVGDVEALLPSYAIDFVLKRLEGLTSWSWSDNYVGFYWDNGAWVRAQLVIGKFPEKAGELIRTAYDSKPTQIITDDFRAAFNDVATLAEDTIKIYADRIESKFKRSVIEAAVNCEVPEDKECSIWGARFLLPVIEKATCWQPSLWPKPTPFKGEHCAGFVIGRKE